jgi:hypothetical protein
MPRLAKPARQSGTRFRKPAAACALLALLLAACPGSERDPAVPSVPLFLNAASQDRALFLTWNRVRDARRVVLYWRRAGREEWQQADALGRGHHLVVGLENDVDYECRAEREERSGERRASAIVSQRPRVRQFAWPPLVFASEETADAWLATNGVERDTVRLVGQPATTWKPGMPDGLYATADNQFHVFLLRVADDTFRPPAAPRSPDDVRAVLKRTLWPTGDPFDHPERFATTITPIEPPIVGNVRRFATASSFAITYHPQLASRCTRFTPREPSPGRIAIYSNGHDGATVRYGASIIDQLLERGWEVVALDMPLTGANAPDVSPTLRNHNAFVSWQAEDFCPVSLFLEPVKALVDQLHRDDPSPDPTVMLIGKSGGGWTSFMYGALDARIDYVVSIAGGVPLSLRLKDPPIRLGDYEQATPEVYESVPYEDIMTSAGSRGAFYVFNQHDRIFRVRPGEPFVRYLEDASAALGKPIGVYVDAESKGHAFSKAALARIDEFLRATAAAPAGR